MDTAILKRAAEAFAAIDVTAANDRIAEIEADIDRMHEAIARTEARCSELSRAIAEFKGPDAGAVADELLAGATTIVAARAGPSIDEMLAERVALRSGIWDLQSRIDQRRHEVSQIVAETMSCAAAVARPVAEALLAEAREAGERIATAYASLAALSAATRGGAGERERLSAALAGIMGPNGILTRPRAIAVPEAIAEALKPLSGKGRALPAQLITAAGSP